MGRKAVTAKREAKSMPAGQTEAAGRAELRRKTAAAQEQARALAIEAARLMSDDKCEDVVVLDLRGLSSVCDFFVISTGTSARQMRAVAEHIEAAAKLRGEKPFSTSGETDSAWIVLDYVDVVMHVFDAAHRGFYELETLWGDAPRVEWAATA